MGKIDLIPPIISPAERYWQPQELYAELERRYPGAGWRKWGIMAGIPFATLYRMCLGSDIRSSNIEIYSALLAHLDLPYGSFLRKRCLNDTRGLDRLSI